MKLWINGAYIGEITETEANNLREKVGKIPEAKNYAIAVDDVKEMIIVEKNSCTHPIVQRNEAGYYIETMTDKIPIQYCPTCGVELEEK